MFTGNRYHETQGESLPAIAQRMRADIAHLRTRRQLPEQAVVSVRTDQKGTGSGSIAITVSGLRDADVWRTPGVTDALTRDGSLGRSDPAGPSDHRRLGGDPPRLQLRQVRHDDRLLRPAVLRPRHDPERGNPTMGSPTEGTAAGQ